MGDPYHLNRETTDPPRRRGLQLELCALRRHEPPRHGDAGRVHAPEIELYSIDEAFLNLAGFERRGLADYARHIQATVRRDTGIPVSIGIGPTKTLAKVANHLAKTEPDDRRRVRSHRRGRGSGPCRHRRWGRCGASADSWAAWLEAQGITTALDLKRADPKAIRRKMTVVGERLVYELNGRSCLPLELVAPPRQGLTVSRSFGRPLTRARSRSRKRSCSSSAGPAEKLRRQRLMAAHLMVFVMTNRFSTTQPFYGQQRHAAAALPHRLHAGPDSRRRAVARDASTGPGFTTRNAA